MIHNRKLINAMLLAITILVIAFTGCSNTTEVSSDAKTTEDTAMAEKEINDNFIEIKPDTAPQTILDSMKQRAGDYCGSSFYAETIQKIDGSFVGANTIKEYFQGANFRCEEYNDDKLLRLHLYNQDEDIFYEYDGEKDLLKKITKYSSKHNVSNSVYGGIFVLEDAACGDMKTIDYDGKKVIYSERKLDQYECYQWIDAEKGIPIKSETKEIEGGKVTGTVLTDYIVKPNQKFDASVFKYDPNHKTVE